jgi:hypothetical protein
MSPGFCTHKLPLFQRNLKYTLPVENSMKVVCKILLINSLLLVVVSGCSSDEAAAVSYPQGSYTQATINFRDLIKQQKVYVPVYSEIYHLGGDKRFLLTVTAVVRNTSLQDTVYVNTVNYYDSGGSLLRKYLQHTISVAPLASAAFIVEYLENQGGAGASFVIDWGSNSTDAKPLIQAVMTEGVVIESRAGSIAN